MNNNIYFRCLTSALFLSPLCSHGAAGLFENFEDPNLPEVQYTLNNFTGGVLGAVLTENALSPDYAATVRYDDHFLNGPPNGLTNQLGDKYFGFEDVNSSNVHGSLVNRFAIQWVDIDISTYGSNYTFSAFFGELDDNGSEDWDFGDSVEVWANKDGLGFTQIFGIAGTTTGAAPRVDTNFDGTGDGAEITTEMTNYIVDVGSLLGAGTDLTIQIRTNGLASNDEDIAIDNVSVVPEPSTSLLLSLFAILPLLRRSRK